MKRKFLNQIIAVGATAAMVAGLAGCGGGTGEGQTPDNTQNGGNQTVDNGGNGGDVDPVVDSGSPYEVITDANGNNVGSWKYE